MNPVKILCIAIFVMVVGSSAPNARTCDDSSSDEMDFFKICAEYNQCLPNAQEDAANVMSIYKDILIQELHEKDNVEREQQLFG